MKAELRDEYADIANRVYREWVNSDIGGTNACMQVALACQELADRPPRELTDAEIAVHSRTFARGDYTDYDFARAIEAAAHAKQREPQVVKFRAARNKASGDLDVFRLDDRYRETAGWEWLEPAQEFEVRI